ncbi:MAG: WhiB family transcriptional regulator, redox-sensing transcriptional regulator [Pseudonocardiales bacterium]|nr:WhiB family transcriptional regulator, redox-sensing transcriptional regulator [Pseudonocardiales bacterium]
MGIHGRGVLGEGGRGMADAEDGRVNVIVGAAGRSEQDDGAGPEGSDLLPRVEAFEMLEIVEDADEDDWQDRALCAETDPEAFFPEKGGSTREAKRICTGCEVRAQCLEYALAHDERFGIWGGLSERERRRLKRRAG